MSAVGLDLSLSATGVALASGELRTIKSTVDDGTVAGRAHRIADLADRITSCVPVGALAVIEGPAYAAQAQAGVHLRAGLWWLVAHTLTSRGVEVVEIAPSALKKLATGKGNATKPDMRMALFQRTGLDERDDNRVDAFWLRQLGLHLLGADDRIELPKTHLVALEKVRRPAPSASIPNLYLTEEP